MFTVYTVASYIVIYFVNQMFYMETSQDQKRSIIRQVLYHQLCEINYGRIHVSSIITEKVFLVTVQLSFNLTLVCTILASYPWILARYSCAVRESLFYSWTHKSNTSGVELVHEQISFPKCDSRHEHTVYFVKNSMDFEQIDLVRHGLYQLYDDIQCRE